MASKLKGLPLRDDADTTATASAIDALQKRGVAVWRPSPHQLKVGDLNFWPNTGRITRDGAPKIAKQGLGALLAMLPQRSLTIDLED